MKKSTMVLTALLAFFAGLALGLLASPLKNGIGNNSGNVTNHYYNGKQDDEPEEEDDPDAIPF